MLLERVSPHIEYIQNFYTDGLFQDLSMTFQLLVIVLSWSTTQLETKPGNYQGEMVTE